MLKMDGHSQAQAAHNGHRQNVPDISKSTLSATAPIFIPRSYQPPPPPGQQQMIPHEQQQNFGFQNNEAYLHHQEQQQQQHHQQQHQQHQQQHGFNSYHQGGHRGGYGGGGGGGYYNNRGNYRGRGRGRGYRGGRGRGNYHGNNYHGGHQGQGMHQGGAPGFTPYMVPSQDPVEQIKQVIALLTDDPAMFDETMQPLTASLATLIRSEAEMQNIIEQLFSQSVRETNFRYTGARMCNFFSQNLHVNIPNGNFRTLLLKRCLDEHNKRDQMAQSPGTANSLTGFTLFIGELLVNLTEEQATQNVVHVLTTAIQELVGTLLNAGFDSCLRCVVQVLKLTGATLDKVEAAMSPSGRPERMDAIFERIKALIQEERMQMPTSRSIKVYLQSVIDLRLTDWGKKDRDGQPKQINPYLNMEVPTPLPDPNAGMMFDSAGLPSFPVWSNGTPEFNGDPAEEQQEIFWSPSEEEEYLAFMMTGEQEEQFGEEMDEEIADAFEEFMKENDARQKAK